MLNPKFHSYNFYLENRLLLSSHPFDQFSEIAFLPPRFESRNFSPIMYLRERILHLRGGRFRNCLSRKQSWKRSKAWTFRDYLSTAFPSRILLSSAIRGGNCSTKRVTSVQAMTIIGGGSRGTISWQWTRPALNVDGELIEILFRLDACNGCFVSNVCFLRSGEREGEKRSMIYAAINAAISRGGRKKKIIIKIRGTSPPSYALRWEIAE